MGGWQVQSTAAASQKTLDRGEELETHAYAFIHTDDIKTRHGRVVWRQYAVRRNHWQSAVSAER